MIEDYLETMIVACAGRGVRLGAEAGKPFSQVCGEPLLLHVLRPWARLVDKLVIVHGGARERLEEMLEELPCRIVYVEQKEYGGSGGAIVSGMRKTGEQFAALLGDCMFNGTIVREQVAGSTIVVIRDGDVGAVRENFGVAMRRGHVSAVIEKPASPGGLLCGAGVYFFEKPDVEEAICAMRGEMTFGITDLIADMIGCGVSLRAAAFRGEYINVNSPADITRAGSLIGQSGWLTVDIADD